ncbi:MAG: zinc-ribbon domain-containing protein [Prevotellaceae bacterium]|nr:zinc-ribbon domain-containing protein [Prevotellaceae bacterium]
MKVGGCFTDFPFQRIAGTERRIKAAGDEADAKKKSEQAEEARRCPECGAGNPEGAAFCRDCGTRLAQAKRFCPQCGAEVPPNSRFCNECGTKVEAGS